MLGHRWPPADVRLAMLEESLEVMRALWTGERVDHRGDFYEVENAKLFDPPEGDLTVVVSGFGPKAVELAARVGDGLWTSGPDPDLQETWEQAGGAGPKYGQINVAYSPDSIPFSTTGPDGKPAGYSIDLCNKIISAIGRDKTGLTAEAADVVYHLLVLLKASGVTLDEVMNELERRTAQSGLEEKAARGG